MDLCDYPGTSFSCRRNLFETTALIIRYGEDNNAKQNVEVNAATIIARDGPWGGGGANSSNDVSSYCEVATVVEG